jgi:hypothetical protein
VYVPLAKVNATDFNIVLSHKSEIEAVLRLALMLQHYYIQSRVFAGGG